MLRFGGGNFGGEGSPSAPIGAGFDQAGAHQVLDAAERLGITIIDTAFSYAAGASQEMIGSSRAEGSKVPFVVGVEVVLV